MLKGMGADYGGRHDPVFSAAFLPSFLSDGRSGAVDAATVIHLPFPVQPVVDRVIADNRPDTGDVADYTPGARPGKPYLTPIPGNRVLTKATPATVVPAKAGIQNPR